ncbi:MAG: ABC transporter ATP-binding protein [Spirochaetaceae bacterium]|nr:MAG: ABC transporter ATP-binding protein [Spirochaetaceae bacterium]
MLSVEIQHTLEDFTLDIAFDVGNEVLTLFGPSGAGKSMAVRCIAGLMRPDAGSILHNGTAWLDRAARINLRPQARRVGLVFQDYALFPHLTVEQNISFGLAGLSSEERRGIVSSLMEEMHIRGLEGRYPDELSGGQQQRVALARALAPSPAVLLLDEPFSAVDVTVRTRLLRLVADVQRRRGRPTVFITHDLEDAFLLSDRIAVIERGRILRVGAAAEVFAAPGSHAAARILGTRNVFNSVVIDRAGEGPKAVLRLRSEGGLELSAFGDYALGAAVSIAVRPALIDIVSSEGGVRSRAGAVTELVPALLTGVESRGDRYTLRARVANSLSHGGEVDADMVEVDLSAAAFERRAPRLGEAVRLAIPRDAIHLFSNH